MAKDSKDLRCLCLKPWAMSSLKWLSEPQWDAMEKTIPAWSAILKTWDFFKILLIRGKESIIVVRGKENIILGSKTWFLKKWEKDS